MTWQKVHGLKSKFGCFWLRWTCFGRTNCNSLFYGYSSSGHSTLGAETSEVSLRCVGSKRLISGWDKRSECALLWTSQTSVWSLSLQLFIGMLINKFLLIEFIGYCPYTICKSNYINSDVSFQDNHCFLGIGDDVYLNNY